MIIMKLSPRQRKFATKYDDDDVDVGQIQERICQLGETAVN